MDALAYCERLMNDEQYIPVAHLYLMSSQA